MSLHKQLLVSFVSVSTGRLTMGSRGHPPPRHARWLYNKVYSVFHNAGLTVRTNMAILTVPHTGIILLKRFVEIVPTTFLHFSPPLNLYGVMARNARSSALAIEYHPFLSTCTSSIDPPFIEYWSTCCITCMLCRVPTLVQISPPLKSYGVWARIAWASELFISSIIEYQWKFNRIGWVSIHMSIHMLHHMYVVQSADDHANLSSIEILWYLGKTWMSVSPRKAEWSCKSLLHWNPMVFGQDLNERQP
jgi:hypothetical protein